MYRSSDSEALYIIYVLFLFLPLHAQLLFISVTFHVFKELLLVHKISPNVNTPAHTCIAGNVTLFLQKYVLCPKNFPKLNLQVTHLSQLEIIR